MSSFFDNLVLGLSVAVSWQSLLFCFIGCLLGTLIGILPGIGPAATVAMLLPITFTMDPAVALIMLAGIYYGAQYGGSTTAILVNLPGEASSVVTAIDGHKMARDGRAGVALATAAIASFMAGTIATLAIALFSPVLTEVALKFGAPEFASLMLLGLIASVILAHGSLVKALTMIALGLLLGTVGVDMLTGVERFTFGYPQLYEGLNIVAISMGIFGIAEIMRNLEQDDSSTAKVAKVTRLLPTWDEFKRILPPGLRGTAVGSMLGILPGGGALLSSFVAFALEKRVSRNKDKIGTGVIEGVAAPEAANNAGAQTSFIPMLTLGIPSNAVMAMMIGAMMIQGVQPGPTTITRQPDLFWGLIASMWIGNLMLLILNLPLVGMWVKLLRVPYSILFPCIIVFCAIGAYTISNQTFDVYVVMLFGLGGYFLAKMGYELAPLILAVVISPMFEENLMRALVISRGDPLIFVQRPISAVLLAICALLILLVCLPRFAKKREEVFVEEN